MAEGGAVQEETSALERVLSQACSDLDVSLYDVERRGATLLVTVERPGGLDLDAIAEVARALSAVLDENEAIVPDGQYELEVSSPGLERPLRRPSHFASALGTDVALRLRPGAGEPRRAEGVLVHADEDGIEVNTTAGARRIPYREIERAHTVFDWKAALASARRADDADEVEPLGDEATDDEFDEEVDTAEVATEVTDQMRERA